MTNSESFPYYSPGFDRSVLQPNMYESQELLNLLSSDKLHEQIDYGFVTLAMIRPQIGPDSNTQDLSDLECAEAIESMVEGLGVMAKFSVVLSQGTVEAFYQDARPRMEGNMPQDARYSSRWEEYCDLMTNGPVTALLLYDPEGNAVEKWRGQIGHWDVDTNRDDTTIRGRLGVSRYNNLVHGSDSSASAYAELSILAGWLRDQAIPTQVFSYDGT